MRKSNPLLFLYVCILQTIQGYLPTLISTSAQNCTCQQGFYCSDLFVNTDPTASKLIGPPLKNLKSTYTTCNKLLKCPANKYCPGDCLFYDFVDEGNDENELKMKSKETEKILQTNICCGPGQYLSGNFPTQTCFNCLPGYFQSFNFYTGSVCTPCPPGYYQPQGMQTSCIPCSSGSFQQQAGMTYCNGCQPGYFQPNTGSVNCSACGPGYFASSSGQSKCQSCSPGYYNSGYAVGNCQICQYGFTSQVEASQCYYACPAGMYSTVISSTNADVTKRCLTCPSGMTSSFGSSFCNSTPTAVPALNQTCQPSFLPTNIPTCDPTILPTLNQTPQPTFLSTNTPISDPTPTPTISPSLIPTITPSTYPSFASSTSYGPTFGPSAIPSIPTTNFPSNYFSLTPTYVSDLSNQPTAQITPLSFIPTASPTLSMTKLPTQSPSFVTSQQLSAIPSTAPSTIEGTVSPSMNSTAASTYEMQQTSIPSGLPSSTPSNKPPAPTNPATITPTAQPTVKSTFSKQPTITPTKKPTAKSMRPTGAPTIMPSAASNFPTLPANTSTTSTFLLFNISLQVASYTQDDFEAKVFRFLSETVNSSDSVDEASKSAVLGAMALSLNITEDNFQIIAARNIFYQKDLRSCIEFKINVHILVSQYLSLNRRLAVELANAVNLWVQSTYEYTDTANMSTNPNATFHSSNLNNPNIVDNGIDFSSDSLTVFKFLSNKFKQSISNGDFITNLQYFAQIYNSGIISPNVTVSGFNISTPSELVVTVSSPTITPTTTAILLQTTYPKSANLTVGQVVATTVVVVIVVIGLLLYFGSNFYSKVNRMNNNAIHPELPTSCDNSDDWKHHVPDSAPNTYQSIFSYTIQRMNCFYSKKNETDETDTTSDTSKRRARVYENVEEIVRDSWEMIIPENDNTVTTSSHPPKPESPVFHGFHPTKQNRRQLNNNIGNTFSLINKVPNQRKLEKQIALQQINPKPDSNISKYGRKSSFNTRNSFHSHEILSVVIEALHEDEVESESCIN